MKRKAFTLIELLIVVAIIAILAAIAIPNLLEAQVRSKVSRVKADMATLKTALETFRLDRGQYPPDSSYGVIVYIDRLKYLTTPVAYITSVPKDPFVDKGKTIEYCASEQYNPYKAGGSKSAEFLYPLTYDFAARRGPNGWESRQVWAKISRQPDSVYWGMRSVGPDGWPAWLGDAMPSYDPTNGTVSRGNIYRTSIGEDQPLVTE